MSHPNKSAGAIFDAAMELPPERRAACLREACGGDALLEQRVEALLRAHESAGTFMDAPAVEPKRETPMARPQEQIGDRIGRYKLLQQIGEGGCGVVYMAEQEEPVRRRVALKVIKLGMDTKNVIARFEAERQALALMDHANIAKVFDAGATDTGRPYFVMELVRGVKITDYCDQHNLSTRQRLDLFIQICRAIQHAHQKGIIHRDIKPSNILVTVNDGVAVPKVIDFGIAKATQGKLVDQTLFTAFEQFLGTPAYMSPEQAVMTSLDVDTRSDIYSLGVLLYELLTGETPFDAEKLLQAGLDEIRRTIREQEPLLPSTRFRRTTARSSSPVSSLATRHSPLASDLDWIVMKCLEKDRARRYETANGLAADLERHLRDEPIAARPPSEIYRFQKLVRRHKAGFAAGTAMFLALLIGVVVSTSETIRAQRAEQAQKQLRQAAEAAQLREARLRQRAQANEQKAQTEADKSEQVARFLMEMLQGVNPEVAMSRDTALLREILDKTAARITQELTNEPEVEAKLCATIANVYSRIGEFEKCEAMNAQALTTRRQLFGNDNADVADSLDKLAYPLCQQGKLAEAEACERESLAIRRKLFGKENGLVAISLSGLAGILMEEGKLDEAQSLAHESLDTQRRLSGNVSWGVAMSLRELGHICRSQGKLADAEAFTREELSIMKKLWSNESHVVGWDLSDVGYSLNNLADVLSLENKLAEAESCDRQALDIQRKMYGKEHPSVVATLRGLSGILGREEKFADAEGFIRDVLDIQKNQHDKEDPTLVNTLNWLAGILRKEGKFAESEKVYLEGVEVQKRQNAK